MAFTPAHAAAVLPLLHWTPRPFCAPALILGSIVPDLEYFVLQHGGATWGHDPWGTLYYDLPLGLLLLACFEFVLKRPWALLLPDAHRARWWGHVKRPLENRAWWTSAPFSILLGCWTHLIWDSWTHPDRWGTRHLPILQDVALRLGDYEVRYYTVLQHVSTLLGLSLLVLAYVIAFRRATPQPLRSVPTISSRWRVALLTVGCTLPLAWGTLQAAHRSAYVWGGEYVRAFAGALARASVAAALLLGLLIALLVMVLPKTNPQA